MTNLEEVKNGFRFRFHDYKGWEAHFRDGFVCEVCNKKVNVNEAFNLNIEKEFVIKKNDYHGFTYHNAPKSKTGHYNCLIKYKESLEVSSNE